MNASVAIQVLPTLPDKELVPVVDNTNACCSFASKKN